MAETLQSIAATMVSKGRGILAADESTATIQKRFDAIKVEVRRAHRNVVCFFFLDLACGLCVCVCG
jgi:fructose-bisphosphate aldolase class 1